MIFVLQKLKRRQKKAGNIGTAKKIYIYDENIEKLKNGSAKIPQGWLRECSVQYLACRSVGYSQSSRTRGEYVAVAWTLVSGG